MTIPAEDPRDEPAVAIAIAPADGDLDVASLRELWPAVLQQLNAGPLGAFLAEAMPMQLEGGTLTVAFSDSAALFLRQADRPANRDAVSTAVRAVTGKALRLAYELRSDDELDLEAEGPEAISEAAQRHLRIPREIRIFRPRVETEVRNGDGTGLMFEK